MSDIYGDPAWTVDPDEREPEHAAAYEPHDCADHAVEKGTGPDPSGDLTVWEECELCGRQLSPARKVGTV